MINLYLTEKECFGQYQALQKTFDVMMDRAGALKEFYAATHCKGVVFLGCGSSYSLAKSAALAARLRLGIQAYAVAAGDLLLNFEQQAEAYKGFLLVSLSRSGSTSEVVLLVERAKREWGAKCVSLCAKAGSELSKIADFNLEFPWAFDESVCQTRCVSNLYLAGVLFSAILADDQDTSGSMRSVIEAGPAYIEKHQEKFKELSRLPWSNIVVLADGELCGIAEEGALAFTEISMLPSRYYHLLDVRHGPIVLVGGDTLVIAALTPGETEHQYRLLEDIKKHGATLVTLSDTVAPPQADYAVTVAHQAAHVADGLPFIFICQALSFFKALERGGNPDAPTGLDPWIKL